MHAGAVYWVPTSVQNCAKFVQNCAKLCSAPLSLHLSRTHGEPQEVQGGIVNNNSIGSLVFCPSDASSGGFVDLRIIINASHQIALTYFVQSMRR